MKRFIALFAVVALSVSPVLVAAAKPAPQKVPPAKSSAEAAAAAACKEVQYSKCDFNGRYEIIKIVEQASGRKMFTRPYGNADDQNLKFAREVRANKACFTPGFVIYFCAQTKWKSLG